MSLVMAVCNLCERRALHSVPSMLHTKQTKEMDLNGSNLNITGVFCKDFRGQSFQHPKLVTEYFFSFILTEDTSPGSWVGLYCKRFFCHCFCNLFLGMLDMNLHCEKCNSSMQMLIKHFNNILLAKVTSIILVVSALVLKAKVKYVAES